MTTQINNNLSMAGNSFAENRTITAGLEMVREKNIPAAKAGNLTTRTDNNTGVLTLTANGAVAIADGDIVDLYWANGCRRGMTVGTVSGIGNVTVPIDGGSGDNLPDDESAITVMKQQELEIRFDGDDVQALFVSGEGKCVVILTGDDDVEDVAYVHYQASQVSQWFVNSGITNPVAGDTITKVFMSHGDSTQARKVKIGVAIS